MTTIQRAVVFANSTSFLFHANHSPLPAAWARGFNNHHAMSISASKSGIIPASLAFLTIYNPSLSQNDDTIDDQIVYYYSKSQAQKTRRGTSHAQDGNDREYKNEKLRQIGLAQGMVEFAKYYSRTRALHHNELISLCQDLLRRRSGRLN